MTEEFLGLERNNNSGKIDHPDGGRTGSKDMADAITGAVFNASKHAEEFAFDYGETLETVVNVNNNTASPEVYRKQVQVDFEEELQKMFDPIQRAKQHEESNNKKDNAKFIETDNKIKPKENNKPKSNYKDFGLGAAVPYKPQYIRDGIIWW